MTRLFKRADPLDQPILQLNADDDRADRDFVRGTLIIGMTGGGKTVGPNDTILRGFLRHGMGGVITTAKPAMPPLSASRASKNGKPTQPQDTSTRATQPRACAGLAADRGTHHGDMV